ncbi:hypothetical protein BC938DRAFT_474351, partial [Jimgerdemannia flammicorona]
MRNLVHERGLEVLVRQHDVVTDVCLHLDGDLLSYNERAPNIVS